MDELWFPSEEQLDELLQDRPEFDLAAVKRRTMERIAVPARRHPPLLRGLLALTPEQAERLRPAVQQVDGSAMDKEITMSVLQMLGDRHNAWIKVRFEFPQDLPVGGRMEFRETEFGLGGGSWNWEELERTERSATYLLEVFSYDDLMGKEIALTVRDYGYKVNRNIEGFTVGLKADQVSLAKVDAQGSLVIEDENVTVPEGLNWQDGYAWVEQEDGGVWLYYDGSRGKQTLLLSGGELSTTDDQYPGFEVVVEGSWSHTWTLTYQDLSLEWTGKAALFDPSVTLRFLRIGSLSWDMTLEGDVYGLLKSHGAPIPAELVYADGSTEEVLLDHHAASYDTVEENGWCAITLMGNAEAPLDLSRITAIRLDGQEFPLA